MILSIFSISFFPIILFRPIHHMLLLLLTLKIIASSKTNIETLLSKFFFDLMFIINSFSSIFTALLKQIKYSIVNNSFLISLPLIVVLNNTFLSQLYVIKISQKNINTCIKVCNISNHLDE